MKIENLLDNLNNQDEDLENTLVILINNFAQIPDNVDFAGLLLRKDREIKAINNNTQHLGKLSAIEVVNLHLKANASEIRNSFLEAYMDSIKNRDSSEELEKLISALIEKISSMDNILPSKISRFRVWNNRD